GPSMLMLTLALWLAVAARDRPWMIQLMGLPLAFSFVIRPTNAVPIVVLSLLVLVEHRRYAVRYVVWMLPVAVPFLLFSLSLSLLSPPPLPSRAPPLYRGPKRRGRLGSFGGARAGPGGPRAGAFSFPPPFFLSPPWGACPPRGGRAPPLRGALAAIIVGHWLV